MEINQIEQRLNSIEFDPNQLKKLQDQKNEIIAIKQELKSINLQLQKIDGINKKSTEIQNEISNSELVLINLEKKLTSNDFGHDEKKEILEINKEIESLNDELSAEQDLMAKLINLDPNTVRSKLELIKKSESKKERLEGELQSEKARLNELKLENDQKLKELDDVKFKNIKERLDKLNVEVSDLEKKYIKSIEDNKQAEQILKQHQNLMKDQKQLREDIKQIQDKLQEKRDDLDTYKMLEKIFSQIGGRILGRLRYQINVATIDILSQLGNLQLEGITLNEDFSITIQTPLGDEKPSFFSGGQKVRIGFAFRLALSKVLAEFRGNELDTLIIDEGGFGALDEDGQDGVIDVFKSLQDRFERVLVISHIPKITNNLPGAQLQISDGKIRDIIN
jgi:exonuclease SbcC